MKILNVEQSIMIYSSRSILSKDGQFACFYKNYQERQSQLEMTEAVENALDNSQTIIVEAGTGTGKTFAYLVPAVVLDKKTIVSTGTKNLQDQLFHTDLPFVIKALKSNRKIALLKGRQNYLCHHRLEVALREGRFANKQQVELLAEVNHWKVKTLSGDLSSAHFMTETSGLMPMITSTSDNCLGSDCSYFDDCFVAKARKKALEADIVVVNHHLLMADIVLKDDGFGELLPKVDAFIIDEAHQLPGVASLFFSRSVTSRKLSELASDALDIYLTEANESSDLRDLSNELTKAVADFRLCFEPESLKELWDNYKSNDDIRVSIKLIDDLLTRLRQILQPIIIKAQEIENLHERTIELQNLLVVFLNNADQKEVQWLEIFKKSFALNSTPLDISPNFTNSIKPFKQAAWVFTSATLSVNGTFEFFKNKMGLNADNELRLSSPFSYSEQAIFYLPRYLPEPQSQHHTRAFIERTLPLIHAAKGRCFLLFTSFKALNEAAQLLQTETRFNLWVQGENSKSYLLEQFKKHSHSVLLGTFSFWEGVDVVGDDLCLVAIDKLPFASPGDPVNNARINAIKKQGQNPFYDYQIPEAVMSLKQGAGRLIRSVTDKGVFLLGDLRITSKEYGRIFLADLPPMLPTRNAEITQEFLKQL